MTLPGGAHTLQALAASVRFNRNSLLLPVLGAPAFIRWSRRMRQTERRGLRFVVCRVFTGRLGHISGGSPVRETVEVPRSLWATPGLTFIVGPDPPISFPGNGPPLSLHHPDTPPPARDRGSTGSPSRCGGRPEAGHDSKDTSPPPCEKFHLCGMRSSPLGTTVSYRVGPGAPNPPSPGAARLHSCSQAASVWCLNAKSRDRARFSHLCMHKNRIRINRHAHNLAFCEVRGYKLSRSGGGLGVWTEAKRTPSRS
jgi:hypothetical protein